MCERSAVWLLTGVPALWGVDTRRLTKKIREEGSLLGKIQFPGQELAFEGVYFFICQYEPSRRTLIGRYRTYPLPIRSEQEKPRRGSVHQGTWADQPSASLRICVCDCDCARPWYPSQLLSFSPTCMHP